MEIEVLAIEFEQEPIELCKLLKVANLVGGGGEAKMVISEGYVYLNGEVEYQKRKKVYFEDIVQFNGEAVMPILNPDPKPIEEFTQDIDPVVPDIEQKNQNAKKQQGKKSSVAHSKSKSAATKQAKNKANKKQKAKAQEKPNTPNSRSGRKSISF
ncbi:RNA-binding S4 domain-containing protein [Thalassotalea sp. ND16A]|uniref:RNA-binding S4 domain-containing protein n=1 Tax=Thalassotalea sp. ND16A TaxID=1535422 RepID=UPI000519EF48|nr:RNA-binding S4 domain-containing protein [Thalassotalea sp. ND16A]KGJ95656.1 hypothetical protein ND16A_1191 [Thalassotalea sp. ND16A]